MRFDEARTILNFWTRRFQGKDASTNKVAGGHAREEARQLDWWMLNDEKTPDWRNPRTVAYLTAYVEIAGATFPATGIPLDDGYLWPDRAVMRSLLEARCVAFEREAFRLTDKGEALIAPMLTLQDGEVRRGVLILDEESEAA
jgi:hypothetical protein